MHTQPSRREGDGLVRTDGRMDANKANQGGDVVLDLYCCSEPPCTVEYRAGEFSLGTESMEKKRRF